jgi:hypothetical protein
MDLLLSNSFDHIASKDTTKIRKGLRQIEGILAHICLGDSIDFHDFSFWGVKSALQSVFNT